jgi:hypothetical protein
LLVHHTTFINSLFIEMCTCHLRLHISRHKFTPEEDAHLRAIIAEKGTEDWSEIAKMMPRRDSRQCKERWLHYLSPNLVQCPWNQTEDAMLEAKVLEHGHQWKLFEAFFPGRADTMLKNRFNLLVRHRRKYFRSVMQPVAAVKPAVALTPPEIPAFPDSWDDPAEEDFEWTSV